MDATTPRDLLFRDEVYRIQGAVFEVARTMGHGFLEAVYQECLSIEFEVRGVPFEPMPRLALSYRGTPLRQSYAPDFVCFGTIIVELKALARLAPEHHSQVLNYLKASGLKVGLLVNFGAGPKAQVERFAL